MKHFYNTIFSRIHKTAVGSILMFVAFFSMSSCVNESFVEAEPDLIPDSSISQKSTGYMVFRIFLPGDNTRAAWDSATDDKFKNGNTSFNSGLEYEYALYQPQSLGETSTETATPTDEEQFYHFALLFDTEGNLAQGPVKLELIRKVSQNEDEYDYIVYCRIYGPDDVPFPKEFNGTVWVVLNASYNLETEIKTAITAKSETFPYTISDLKSITLSKESTNSDFDNFLYLKNKKGQYITNSGHPYLTMSSSIIINSTYTSEPAVNGSFRFYKTIEDAEKNPTAIYVERLQAKYTVIFKGPDSNYYYLIPQSSNSAVEPEAGSELGTADNPKPTEHLIITPGSGAKTLKFVKSYDRSPSIDKRNKVLIHEADPGKWYVNIVGWNVNGREKGEYLFKNMDNAPYFTGWDSWGTMTNSTYRTFWAEDKNYNGGIYPEQYRPVEGVNIPNYYSDSATLIYYDYSALSGRATRQYIPENTFDAVVLAPNNLSSLSYMHAGSHLIVTAQLLIENFDDQFLLNNMYFDEIGLAVDNANIPATSKFYMNDIYWDKSAYLNYAVEYLAYFMLEPVNQAEDKFGPNDGNFYVINNTGDYILATGGNFDIESANIKGGDGYVKIKPTEDIYIYNLLTQTYTKIFDVNKAVDNLTPLIDATPELMAGHYNNGRMYYSMGSYHNRSVSNRDKTVSTGDFGTVRNTWYAYTVDEITKPGTPVDMPSQEIIPNNELEQEAVGMSIQILDWHKIYTAVDVSDQNRPGKN